ncbi:hypothetical protein A4D02_29315 [Niastella koreensis]|uniref:Cytochrome B n=2 Tax=Niastella koreensis TaxID=354356 RepID=G8TPD4_NIAKG|nr:hypothetical protein [Niastella koreensis]AEV96740.1 hypothetical protein Niako_0342 [Niastella koreensis GR20-10]OQP49098.1 hypothetical protein A4D02_29315 [Niastella koreensis]
MNILVVLHSWLRWILLILLLVSIVKSLSGFSGKKALSAGDKKIWLFTMITAHTTLLIGLILLFFGRSGIVHGAPAGVSVMKDSFYRFYWVEHPVMMIIAIALITVGRGQAKKSIPDVTKYKKAFWFFLLALLVILAAIPWPGRAEIGRALVPGM